MKKIYTSILDLIGPHAPAGAGPFQRRPRHRRRLLVKLEAFNPGGSAKDRHRQGYD